MVFSSSNASCDIGKLSTETRSFASMTSLTEALVFVAWLKRDEKLWDRIVED
jgi:hypothetical protein